MAGTATTTAFSREALKELQRREGSTALRSLRQRAFEQFEATPMPSPETEEWRYTDLREFDLSGFAPMAEEPRAETLDEVKPDLLEAAGARGVGAGLSIQHPSTGIPNHLAPSVEAQGARLHSLARAAQPP